jgi:hypothetical protein
MTYIFVLLQRRKGAKQMFYYVFLIRNGLCEKINKFLLPAIVFHSIIVALVRLNADQLTLSQYQLSIFN